MSAVEFMLRADFRLAPSQWETALQSKLPHWWGANLESALSRAGPCIYVEAKMAAPNMAVQRAGLAKACPADQTDMFAFLQVDFPVMTPCVGKCLSTDRTQSLIQSRLQVLKQTNTNGYSLMIKKILFMVTSIAFEISPQFSPLQVIKTRSTHYMKVTTYAPPFPPPFFRSRDKFLTHPPPPPPPLYLRKNVENVVFRPLFFGKMYSFDPPPLFPL